MQNELYLIKTKYFTDKYLSHCLLELPNNYLGTLSHIMNKYFDDMSLHHKAIALACV
jgi:hypothetical protein